jgi:hypothetical protein
MIFDISLSKITRWLVPHFLGRPRHLAWLRVLLSPVVHLYDVFLDYRKAKLKEATINSQVLRLNQALREKFNHEQIYIQNSNDFLNQSFVYLSLEGATVDFDHLQAENQPSEFDFLLAEYENEFDFTIRIPAMLAPQRDEVAAFVNRYKLAGKQFTVELT